MNKWYNTMPVKFEIVKNTQRRELAILKPVFIRGLNLYRADGLSKVFELAEFDKNQSNMYISNATLKNIPKFTYNRRLRGIETRQWFKTQYFDEVVGYDVFFDMDLEEGGSWDDLVKETNEFLQWFRDWKVPYYVLFSGNKGFQIIIPYEYLPTDLTFDVDDIGNGKPDSVYIWNKKFIENCKEVFSLKRCDLANVGICNRLRKCPYSLVGNNVALPLTDFQMQNWYIEQMNYEAVLSKIMIKERGLLTRTYGLSQEDLRYNLKDFVKEFKLTK